jgi:hypothetical protein
MASQDDRRNEQRKSYRCPVAPAQQEAELRFRGRRLPVRLYNESAGGFAACSEQEPDLKPGDTVELANGTDSFPVRVAHVGRIEPKPGVAVGATVFRIGLDRMDSAPPPSEKKNQAGQYQPSRATLRLLPTNVSAVVVSTAVSLLIAFALAAGLAYLIRQNHPLAQYLYHGHAPQALGSTVGDAAPTPKSPLAEVAPELGLSDAQQRRVHDAAEAMASAFADLDPLWRHVDARDRSKKQAQLWEAAEKEILRTLKDEDRRRWEPILR